MRHTILTPLRSSLLIALGVLALDAHGAGGLESPRHMDYSAVAAPEVKPFQSPAERDAKSAGCRSCHTETDQPSMHRNPAVVLGCTDCHGGNASVFKAEDTVRGDAAYRQNLDAAHVQPRYPEAWHYPSSANPERSYSFINLESPEFIRFVNPGDYRVADKSCGACHQRIVNAAKRSLMATTAMLWGGAAYNNGLLPFKRYVLGEAYTENGEAALITAPEAPTGELKAKGALPALYPLPPWETLQPTDVFRVFERGGRNIANLFPETGLPNALGQIQRLEEPGRPDIRQSNRGLATGARIAVPVINIYKTRLNDPTTWFFGTNDQAGDYRSSGCSSCHVVYANDRDPRHSGHYAQYGHTGTTQTSDPTINRNERGHPLKHEFTKAIPTSQCMICHMHQPNMFVNSYLGYTMWDYESDAEHMWPQRQRYVSDWDVRPGTDVEPAQILGHHEAFNIISRNPEEAATRGLWGDRDFLEDVSTMNAKLRDTQFADYHGHGWNFRAVFKRDRDGALLDAEGEVVPDDAPDKFDRVVHMSSIHLDVGMHCVDCHFGQDNHGNGHLYGEVAQAVEIDCIDCHGTTEAFPNLRTTGPAAVAGATDLGLLRTPDGRRRFVWLKDEERLIQRSTLDPELEWNVPLVKNSVDPERGAEYNEKAARAKLLSKDKSMRWGPGIAPQDRAHSNDEMVCFTCHSAWATSCGGCHLPIQANWKTRRHHYDFDESRNFATYNPQVARDQMYQLGRHGPAKGNRIAPIRSSSALILSSTNANRERIYIQQPPIASSGFSSQAFSPHFPHTVRKTETKTCTDCHLSENNDNNAIMAQLLLYGTNFVNFVGFNAWVGSSDAVTAVRVTEWDEPQAVLGSYLHRYAYPDWYRQHQKNARLLEEAYSHRTGGEVGCLQLRGEYLYVAQGSRGMEVYDVASIANKGFSQRIVSAPFSPLGHNTRIDSRNATCVVLPTNQPIHPQRRTQAGFGLSGEAMHALMTDENLERDFHAIYDYALITDAQEGLILTDINALADQEPRNNFLQRSLTWNPDGILTGARHLTVAGYRVYVTADAGLIVLNLNEPLQPKVEAVVPLEDARSSAIQFRYLFVTDKTGLVVVDVTDPSAPAVLEGRIALADAHRIYLARTYAYVAAGSQGLAIIDIEHPDKPVLHRLYDADGELHDARDVVVGTTNASLFAYVADGASGLKVLQLTSPETQPRFYGFSPEPKPALIAAYQTGSAALSLSRGLERDRAVDETGNQIAVFGRLGSGPLSYEDMRRMYLDATGKPWYVTDELRRSDYRD